MMAVHRLGATLSPDETRDIVSFLETLTGEAPKVAHPTLPPRAKEDAASGELFGSKR